jgi:hypothetical protein
VVEHHDRSDVRHLALDGVDGVGDVWGDTQIDVIASATALHTSFKAELLALNTLGPTNSTVHPSLPTQLVEVYAQVVKSLLMQTPGTVAPTVTAISAHGQQ